MGMDQELRSRLVFIDTCCFISKHFNFGIHSLERTETYIDEGKIQLLMPDITKSEIEKKIKEKSQEAHLALKKLFTKENSIKIMTVADGLAYSGVPQIPSPEDIYNKINDKFKDFLNYPNVEIVSTEFVNPKTIFNNYFNSMPPFDKENKKYEFPDAFVLEAINNISKSRNHEIYVISSDPDLISYTKLHDNLIHLKNINDLNSLIIHNDEELKAPARFADGIFKFFEKEITSRALSHFENAEYMASHLSEYTFDDIISLVTVNDVEISGKNILNVTDIDAEFEVTFSVALKVDFSVPNHDSAVYDRESGRIYNFHYSRFSENYVKEYSANVKFEYEDKIKNHAEIVEFEFEDDIFDVG